MSRHLPRTSVTAAAIGTSPASPPDNGASGTINVDVNTADGGRRVDNGTTSSSYGAYESSTTGALTTKTDPGATSGAIQWVGIGNNNPSTSTATARVGEEVIEELASPTQSESDSGVLTASSLLRTFYANRESVIRTPAAAPSNATSGGIGANNSNAGGQDDLEQQQKLHPPPPQQQQHPHVVTPPFHHPHHQQQHQVMWPKLLKSVKLHYTVTFLKEHLIAFFNQFMQFPIA